MSEEFLRIDNLSKTFGSTTVVHGVSLSFDKGEFITFLGPSGCGKTTILRMIAGFEEPSAGTIAIDGQDITHIPPNKRRLGMVFQAYALFPNMTVAANIGFGLKVGGVGAEQTHARVGEMLDLIGLRGFEKRYPFELSGGQQQRVALARALAPQPRMLLLDEPLSALDAKIRVSLRDQIREIQRDLGITTVFVTHDQEEALSVSDRIVVLNAGNVEQVGAPMEIYNQPATRFVATFVGILNTLSAKVDKPADNSVILAGGRTRLTHLPTGARPGDDIAVALRPEAISLGKPVNGDLGFSGRVSDVSFLGSTIRLRVALGSETLELDLFNDQHGLALKRGDTIDLHVSPAAVLVLD